MRGLNMSLSFAELGKERNLDWWGR